MYDKEYMRRAIDLAKMGEGFTNPNPLVGAVIVKENKIIGEGYHAKYGEFHAERNAINSLTESAQGATIYVTLEPCCHYGKTPPCTECIIESGITRVVIGSRDPNPKVAGKGASILRDAGLAVEEDFLREECDSLNRVFFHYITTRTPYVVSKFAMSADGKIATASKQSKWISNETSRELVQKMRGKYMGIMVGIGTVLADNPTLNARIEGARNPIRIICDSNLNLPIDSNICKTAKKYQTIVACSVSKEDCVDKWEQLSDCGIEIVTTGKSEKVNLSKLMKILGEKGIDSIMLEGGGTLNYNAFLSGVVNEVKIFIAPKIVGGKEALTAVEGEGIFDLNKAVLLEFEKSSIIDGDILLEYKVGRK